MHIFHRLSLRLPVLGSAADTGVGTVENLSARTANAIAAFFKFLFVFNIVFFLS